MENKYENSGWSKVSAVLWENRIEVIDQELKNGCYLYGAGVNGEWVLEYCKRIGIRVLGFIDSSQKLFGKKIEGIDIISYERYLEQGGGVVFVTTKHHGAEIMKLHWDNELMIPFDAWFVEKRTQEFDLLEFCDDVSYETLAAIRSCMRESNQARLYKIVSLEQYFCIAPFFQSLNEIFVDLGACTGDSIERFFFTHVGSYKHIYAFEPGEVQIRALKKRIERLSEEWAVIPDSITVQQGIVGAETGEISLDRGKGILQTRETKGDTGIIVKKICLDDYFSGENITFIKADIEGSEYEMLLGAEQLIKRCVPKIAISVYHRPDDLIRIYTLLKKWIPTYRFALRQHASALVDTVLYCWTES